VQFAAERHRRVDWHHDGLRESAVLA
jgi:hypothetical protein